MCTCIFSVLSKEFFVNVIHVSSRNAAIDTWLPHLERKGSVAFRIRGLYRYSSRVMISVSHVISALQYASTISRVLTWTFLLLIFNWCCWDCCCFEELRHSTMRGHYWCCTCRPEQCTAAIRWSLQICFTEIIFIKVIVHYDDEHKQTVKDMNIIRNWGWFTRSFHRSPSYFNSLRI